MPETMGANLLTGSGEYHTQLLQFIVAVSSAQHNSSHYRPSRSSFKRSCILYMAMNNGMNHGFP